MLMGGGPAMTYIVEVKKALEEYLGEEVVLH